MRQLARDSSPTSSSSGDPTHSLPQQESIADLIPMWFEGCTPEQMLDEAFAQIRLLEGELNRKRFHVEPLA